MIAPRATVALIAAVVLTLAVAGPTAAGDAPRPTPPAPGGWTLTPEREPVGTYLVPLEAPHEIAPELEGGPAPIVLPISEDDPRWDCRTMGNLTCGVEIKGAWYDITFVDGEPVGVTPR